MAIDREEILEFVLEGLGTTEGACVQSWFPHLPGYDHTCQTDAFDPDGAVELLRQAGYEDPSDLTIRLTTAPRNSLPECQPIAEAVAQQWSNLGIDVVTIAGDYAVLVETNTADRNADYGFCYAPPTFASSVQLFGFYSRTTDRLSYSGEAPLIDQLINEALAAEAAGGETAELAARALFDYARDNVLGIPLAYEDKIFFGSGCFTWGHLDASAWNYHHFEFMGFDC